MLLVVADGMRVVAFLIYSFYLITQLIDIRDPRL